MNASGAANDLERIKTAWSEVIMEHLLGRVSGGAVCLISAVLFMSSMCVAQVDSGQAIRVGIIGVDTSHAIEFTRIFNDPSDPEHVAGVRVVAAYKGGSPDVVQSRDRVDKYAAELRDKWKIEIVDDIPRLCSMVDGVLLESVDGRTHLNQVKPVFAARKPVFIDKPLAASYRDAKEIARLASEAGVPWFSSSISTQRPSKRCGRTDQSSPRSEKRRINSLAACLCAALIWRRGHSATVASVDSSHPTRAGDTMSVLRY